MLKTGTFTGIKDVKNLSEKKAMPAQRSLKENTCP